MEEGYFFKEPRLAMSFAGRFAVRLVGYFSYGVLFSAMVIFFFTELAILQATSAIIGLFFLDLLFHFRQSERSLASASIKHPNVRLYTAPSTYSILEAAMERAVFSKGSFDLYLFSELIRRPEVRKSLVRLDVSPQALLAKTEDYLRQSQGLSAQKKQIIEKIEKIMLLAFEEARRGFAKAVEPAHIFSAVSQLGDDYIKRLIALFDLRPGDLASVVVFRHTASPKLTGFFSRHFRKRARVINRAWTSRPTPKLDKHSTDLTGLARAGEIGFIVGHEAEYKRVVDILSRESRPNALLIGEPGVGKDTLVRHLAFQMVNDRVPKPLFDKRLVEVHFSNILAHASGDNLENMLREIAGEVAKAGNVILYIPDIHQLSKSETSGRLSAIDVLLPIFRDGFFSVIGATTPREYKKFLEPNSEFSAAFEEVEVQELSEEESERYLAYKSLLLERPHDIVISFGAIKQAVKLAHKYFRQSLLPTSAEDLLKEALAKALREGKTSLTAEEVISTAESRVNVPMRFAGKAEAESLLNLEEKIHESLIDQEEAVVAVSRSLREYRSGLSRKGAPIASFLFVGPTGVGKTELSKILSKLQFGSEKFLVRFDMSEYQQKESLVRFIGSADGSIFGSLTDAVLKHPYSLILLDEFEKANSDIINLFLQVLDDGRITDGLGRVVSFENTIVIATSNAHSVFIKESLEKGRTMEEISGQLKTKLTDFFRPELLNRFSKIIVFKTLSRDDIKKITQLKLKELKKILLETQGVSLECDESAVLELARLGFDPVFGARPLRGVISEKLNASLAERILKGQIKRGDSVLVGFNGASFEFSAK